MVIFYRVNELGHKIVGPFLGISTPHLALVNILAGKRIVPELMPWYGRIKPVREMVLDVMEDLGCLYDMREAMREVTARLRTSPPASDNAADLAVQMLKR